MYTKYAWIPSDVDINSEYITLYYDDRDDKREALQVAYISPPKDGVFNVKFLIEATTVEHTAALWAAQRELNFYLIDKDEPDPWSYAKYHCTTGANVYSKIHWSLVSP